MRIHIGVVAVVSLSVLVVCSAISDASQYGGAGAGAASPVRSATTPVSRYQSGLIGRPNPLDSSGNRVVTGNVSAGKHFRGPVPYRSTTSMSAPLGSTSLDSFMRYTAVPETPRASAGTYGSFYSPTRTMTSMPPGARLVSTPVVPRIGAGAVQGQEARAGDTLYSDLRSSPVPLIDTGSLTGAASSNAVPRLRLWPLSETPDPAGNTSRSIGEPLTERPLSPPRAETVTGRDYRQQMEALQQRLGQVKAELSALEQGLAAKDDPSQTDPGRSHRGVAEGRGLLPFPETPIPARRETLGTEAGASQSRKNELLQEAARLLAGTTGLPAANVPQDDTTMLGSDVEGGSTMSIDTERRLQLYRPNSGLSPARKPVDRDGFGAIDASLRTQRAEATSRVLDRSVTEPGLAEAIVVQPSVQSSVWKLDTEKGASSLKAFDRHFQAARQHAQRGRYKQAAEAFALASIYRPNDPRAYLGKSHALFAFGQYIGSALVLDKAIELDPSYALKKSDLVWIAGGPDAFIARFNALDEAIQAGVTPHLQFLLAYVYYQMDRPDEARAAIDDAKRALPSSTSVDLLKAAIDR